MVVLCALDNLAKGASGGALQAGQRRARAARDGRAARGRAVPVSAVVERDKPRARRPAVLVEALPYIRRFAGKIVVVKYGGNALAGASDADALGPVRRRTSC